MISNSISSGFKYSLTIRFVHLNNQERSIQNFGTNVLELIDDGLRRLDILMPTIKEITHFKVEPI